MELVHRIAVRLDTPLREELCLLGFKFTEELSVIVMDEADKRWPSVAPLVRKYSPYDLITEKFSDEEIRSARYLAIQTVWHNGYPQPEDSAAYETITYDKSQCCHKCRRGIVQKSPFRIRKEPKWGRNSVFVLNWVIDELFIRPERWKPVLDQFGISYREVLHCKTTEVLETVVQLNIPDTDVPLFVENSSRTTVCDMCGRFTMESISPGFFPALNGHCDHPIFKTKEFFGATKWIVFSGELCAAMRDHQLQGIGFRPLASF